MKTVDNFELIKKNLSFAKKGDCYFIQLLRRNVDDPMIDGKKDPRYHGRMHSRSSADFLVTSPDELDEFKEDIKAMCKALNVRAYIRMNPRNLEDIRLGLLTNIVTQMNCKTVSNPFGTVQSVIGKVCTLNGEERTWLVDLDAEHIHYKDQIVEYIAKQSPMKHQAEKNFELIMQVAPQQVNGESPYKIYADSHFLYVPTPHGMHVICHKFNRKSFIGNWPFKDIEPPKIHKDNPTILYAVER